MTKFIVRKYLRLGKVVVPYLSIRARAMLWNVVSTELEHGMRVYDYVFEKRLRDMVAIGNYQFGF